jgi:uncharacterized membrane protein YsdA (DUF1294 family)
LITIALQRNAILLSKTDSMPRPPDLLNLVAWIAALWLAAAAVLLVLVFGSSVRLHWTTTVYLGSTVLFSVLAFGAMGLDKSKAGRGKRRIAELTLHIYEMLGGWPGSLLGQRTFHHKTRKVTYQAVFWGIVFVHLALIAWTIYMWKTLPSTQSPPSTATQEPKSAAADSQNADEPLPVIEPKQE